MTSTYDEQMESAEEEWLDGWKKGPQRLRWTKIPLQIGDKAPDFVLPNSNGQLTKLSDFWQD